MLRLFFLLLLLTFSCTGKTVYDLSFIDLKGRQVRIARTDKPLLLYVWTGTCTGHQEDMSIMNAKYEALSERYRIVSLAVFMKPSDVKTFLRQSGLKPKFVLLTDPQGNITSIVKLIFLPASLIFDPSGKLLGNYPRLPLNELLNGNVAEK